MRFAHVTCIDITARAEATGVSVTVLLVLA
jgi:hypothetical protein